MMPAMPSLDEVERTLTGPGGAFEVVTGAVGGVAALVGLNGWWTADEILYGLEDSGARVLVADTARLDPVRDQLSSLPALEAVFEITGDGGSFADLLGPPADAPPPAAVAEDD